MTKKYNNAKKLPSMLNWKKLDDGTRGAKSPKNPQYSIATHGFLYEDQLILVHALEKNFSLQCSVNKDKNYFRLVIKSESASSFRALIVPHIHPYFEYKL